jgi:hypothetical protein
MPPLATVVSVVAAISPYQADWIFAAPVTLVGSGGGDAPELEIDGEGEGFVGPDSVTQVNSTTIRGDYFSSSGIEAGNAWRVLSAPAHITPPLAVPQSGNCV